MAKALTRFTLSLAVGLAGAVSLQAQTTVTLPAVADTTLRQQNANQNRGAETYLRIGHNQNHRGLVRFDQAAITAAVGTGTLVSAHLELFAETSNQWPAGGRPVDVHRLTRSWTEAGATWNCPVDANPNNNQAECAPQWAGGSFAATATASLVHTSATAGVVRYDVTSDVASFLAGTATNNGWLLKRRLETQDGRVDYTSKEGLIAANRPRLVLVVQGGGGDTVPPTITAAASPLPNAAGWNNTGVTVTFTCSDADSGVASCPPPVTVTAEGAGQVISGTARDNAGNTATASVTLNIDRTAPLVTIASPPTGSTFEVVDLTVTGSASDALSGLVSLRCNGADTPATGAAFSCTIALLDGLNVLAVQAVDRAGNAAEARSSAILDRDTRAPRISILAPATGSFVIETRPLISLSYDDESGVDEGTLELRSGGVPLAADCQAREGGSVCTPLVDLAEGPVALVAAVRDLKGNQGTASAAFTVDTVGLEIEIASPGDATITAAPQVVVSGTVSADVATVEVNGVAAAVAGGAFSATVPLREGTSMLVAVGRKANGRTGTDSIEVTRDIFAPIVRIDSPRDGLVSSNPTVAVTGLVNDIVHGGTNADVRVNGVAARVGGGAFLLEALELAPGPNEIEARAVDVAGNAGAHRIRVIYQPPVGERVRMAEGNGQTGRVGSQLLFPLVAQVVDEVGNPVAGRAVTFAVSRNSGLVAPVNDGDFARQAIVITDGAGRAAVRFRLGATTGEGTNRVLATALGVGGEVEFCATAEAGAPDKILMTMGDNQRGVTGYPLATPLEALVVDAAGNPVAGVPVTFMVTRGAGQLDGAVSAIRATSLAGLARTVLTLSTVPGINNNVVEATFDGNLGLPATFTSSGLAAGDPAATRMSGVVLDNAQTPIPGAAVTVEGGGVTVSAVTDTEGQFLLTGVPAGPVHLRIDPALSPRPERFPPLAFETVTVAGQENTIGQPIQIPALDPDNGAVVGGPQDVTIAMAGVAGLNLTVFAHSVTFPDGSHVGTINISQVHLDKVPMPPPSGTFFMPPAWTVQPHGVVFDPPARITIPNDGLAPGQIIDIFQFDHALNQFINVGKGTVTEDASLIISDPGFGITRAGWGGCGNPPPPDTCGDGCDDKKVCNGVEKCVQGKCQPGTPPPPGTSCDDGDKCTEMDKCQGGACKGEKIEIKIVSAPVTICKGNTKAATATVKPAGISVIWTSTNPASLSVSGGGTSASLTGVAKGNAGVQAKDANGNCSSDSRNVRVIEKEEFDGMGEKTWCLLAGLGSPEIGAACGAAYSISQRVLDWQGATFSSSHPSCRGEGSAADAARHARWSCELHTSPLTRDFADTIMELHENRPDDDCVSHEQDFNNNQQGKQNAQAGRDCTQAALNDLAAGRLQMNSPPASGVRCP